MTSNLKKENYEEYLLKQIDKYKDALKGIMPGRIREGLEMELQDYEARLFNFRKGYKQALFTQNQDILKMIDERIVLTN
jgi:hypothetical protein